MYIKKTVLCIAAFVCSLTAFGQLPNCSTNGAPFTPNVQLVLPPYGTPNWNNCINGNLNAIDSAIGRLQTAFQGSWSSTAVYSRGQMVNLNNVLYISLINSNFNNNPATATTAWSVVLSNSFIGAFQGAWSAGTTYAAGNIVTFNGGSFISLISGNIGNTPNTSPADWGVLAAAGTGGGATLPATPSIVKSVTTLTSTPAIDGTDFLSPHTGLPLAGGTMTGPLNLPPTSLNFNVWRTPGDSLTAGNEGVVQLDTYPSILQTLIGPVVDNDGIGGQTSTQIAVRMGATPTSWQNFSGNILACPVAPCASISVTYPVGFEPVTASTTNGVTLAPTTGTVQTSPAIHGTAALASEYVTTGTWSISGGILTINSLVLVAGSSTTFSAGNVVTIAGITGATGCSNVNGPQTLTGGSSSSVSFATTCTGSGGAGPSVSLYTFTPDAFTPGATVTGNPVFNVDPPCNTCNSIIWVGRNNLIPNSLPSGPSIVEGSVAALEALIPSNRIGVVMPVIPENVPTEFSSGTNYPILTAYRSFLASTYPTQFVDVWTALVNAANTHLPTDAADVANNNVPTSLRAITAQGTLTTSVGTSDTNCSVSGISLTLTNGAIQVGFILTLDAGSPTLAENVFITSFSGSSITSCTRGYAGTPIVAHTAGGPMQISDPTHLNAAGYGVVAQSIASHVQALSVPATNTVGVGNAVAGSAKNSLNRANTFGAFGVRTQTIGGSANAGLQFVFGNAGGVQNSAGAAFGSAVYMAYNAKQTGGSGIDEWTAPFGTNNSYLFRMEQINGLAAYFAAAGTVPGSFSSFWGSPLFTINNGTMTWNRQSVFTNSLNKFINGADSTNTIDIGGGLTADQRAGHFFLDKSNTLKWGAFKETDNSYRIHDFVNNIDRISLGPTGGTNFNSTGTLPVQLNSTPNSGTGGLVIQSGGPSPVGVASFTPSASKINSLGTGSTNCVQHDATGNLLDAAVACGPGNIVFNFAGNAQSTPHLVTGRTTLSGGTATVTLVGGAVYTSSTSYNCNGTDTTGLNPVQISNTDGSHFTVNGTGTDSVSLNCVGN